MSKRPHTRINKGDIKGALLKIQTYQLKGIWDYSISSIRREFRVGIQRSVVPDMRDTIVDDELVKEVRKKSTSLIKQSQLKNRLIPIIKGNVEDSINSLFGKLLYELEMAKSNVKRNKAIFKTCMENQALTDAAHFKQRVDKYTQVERDYLQSIAALQQISVLVHADKAKVSRLWQTVEKIKSAKNEDKDT